MNHKSKKPEYETFKTPIEKRMLAPFIAVARGIPDNWPGQCILRFDQRDDGSLYLSYYGVGDASFGITIDQWRALSHAKARRKGGG